MTRGTLLHVTLASTLLGVVTHLFVQSTSVDPEAHVRVLEVIAGVALIALAILLPVALLALLAVLGGRVLTRRRRERALEVA